MWITGFYAALLAVLALWLAWRVVQRRRQARVGLGNGGDEELARRRRAHANLLEYAPMAVLLLLILELQHMPAWLLHAAGVTLVVARLAHAWGISHASGLSRGRLFGTALTWLAILGMAGCLLGFAAGRVFG